MPTYFVSHGAPDIVIKPSPAADFLRGLGSTIGRPRAIVVASAHFNTPYPAVDGDAHPGMIYDFGGFSDELYKIVYPAPGDPAVAEDVAFRLGAEGFETEIVLGRGFDHGTWTPLKLIYPDADIPVVQLAVQPKQSGTHHFRLGAALAGLANENIVVLGSGSATHNLYEFFRGGHEPGAEALGWVRDFSDWLNEHLAAGDIDALLDYRHRAPAAVENHPTDEHLMPLFVALGAAGPGAKGRRLHSSVQNGVLMMDAYAFG